MDQRYARRPNRLVARRVAVVVLMKALAAQVAVAAAHAIKCIHRRPAAPLK